MTELRLPRSGQNLPIKSVGLYSNHGIQPMHETDFDGSAKINQDRGMVTYLTSTRQLLLGVYDGHGKHGELCADFVSRALAELIDEERDLKLNAEHVLTRAFHTVDASLKGAEQIPSDLSGTTAIVALLREKRVTAPPNRLFPNQPCVCSVGPPRFSSTLSFLAAYPIHLPLP